MFSKKFFVDAAYIYKKEPAIRTQEVLKRIDIKGKAADRKKLSPLFSSVLRTQENGSVILPRPQNSKSVWHWLHLQLLGENINTK